MKLITIPRLCAINLSVLSVFTSGNVRLVILFTFLFLMLWDLTIISENQEHKQ